MTTTTTRVAPVTQEAQRRTIRPAMWLALAWLLLVTVAALGADLLPLKNPAIDVGAGVATPPFKHWNEVLGTDGLGRSVLSRVIYGGRISLTVGLGSAFIAMVAGLIIGVPAGYFRGKLDAGVGILVDVLLAFPAMVLLLALAASLGPEVKTEIIGLALIATPSFVRLARAQTMRFAKAEFVAASRGLGARTPTILMREILPNVVPTIFAYTGVMTAFLIIVESGLSFLGLGVRSPTASWGNMIADGRSRLADHPALVFVPAITLFVTVYSLNAVGERLRSRGDTVGKA